MKVQKNHTLQKTIEHWRFLASIIHEPQTKEEYDRLVFLLDNLLDLISDDESHFLMGLTDVISYMIASYEERQQHKFSDIAGIHALRFLMRAHDLKQSDLHEIGSQGVVSEILSGKRKLNLEQIKKLAIRFNVSAETFIDFN